MNRTLWGRMLSCAPIANRRKLALFILCAITAVMSVSAQTLTTLYSFDAKDGAYSSAGLVQATDGDFYGTNSRGGAHGKGTVFKITPSGTLRTLYNFCPQSGCQDGAFPFAALVQATNGDLYGTTAGGGVHGNYGTVFKITLSGKLTTLYSFCSQSGCTDGEMPYRSALVQATNGDLYGTTFEGGSDGNGTIFKITPGGTLTTIYTFCSQGAFPDCPDGTYPAAELVRTPNGDFYGTTSGGGNLYFGAPSGTVFKVTPAGTLTTIYSFCSQSHCADGAIPNAGLVQATDGNLYGTTSSEGAPGGGTVFQITPAGALTTLYNFCSQSECTDGKAPEATLVQATGGNLYGTTYEEGANNFGTLFKITPSGTLTTIYSFCSQSGCTDGKYPFAELMQATNGDIYGTTVYGGTHNSNGIGYGTIFSLSVGLGPFVKTQTTSGKAGSVVKILGTDLTGATSVTFNGTPAAFTVVRPSEITTTVRAGATTGIVQVVAPNGTLSSNVPFRVPQNVAQEKENTHETNR